MDEETLRLQLHILLESAFPGVGIYYKPPGNIILKRPCIIYVPTQREPSYANSSVYSLGRRFQVTILSDLPGIEGTDVMFELEGVTVRSNRSYISSDINHDVFQISINSI